MTSALPNVSNKQGNPEGQKKGRFVLNQLCVGVEIRSLSRCSVVLHTSTRTSTVSTRLLEREMSFSRLAQSNMMMEIALICQHYSNVVSKA